MSVRYKHIKNIVSALLDDEVTVPVNIVDIVERMNVEIVEIDLAAISGAAVIKGSSKAILIDKRLSESRKRFTLAHELGHIMLHPEKRLNVDVTPIVHFRDKNSATTQYKKEIEANFFAGELLMPEKLIQLELDKMGVLDQLEEFEIQQLAMSFEVSSVAMSIRLGAIGFA